MKKNYIQIILLLIFVIIISTQSTFSQVLISGASGSPESSAMLEIKSTTKGMLIPRMNTDQRNTLGGSAVAGLLVYDTDFGSFFIFGRTHKGTLGWNDLSTPSGIWQTSNSNVYLSIFVYKCWYRNRNTK